MDNLPFLGLIATVAKGRTLVHDWSYENRAIYFTELSKLNAQIELVDPHRVYITGNGSWLILWRRGRLLCTATLLGDRT